MPRGKIARLAAQRSRNTSGRPFGAMTIPFLIPRSPTDERLPAFERFHLDDERGGTVGIFLGAEGELVEARHGRALLEEGKAGLVLRVGDAGAGVKRDPLRRRGFGERRR